MQDGLSPLGIYYALLLGHALIFRNCEALGGRDVCIGLTRGVGAKHSNSTPPFLTLAEALSLMRNPPGKGSKDLYQILQLDLGSLMEGEWGEEPRSPLLADPRPDLKEDSRLWEQLLALAVAEDEALAEALFAMRWAGSRLVTVHGRYAIRPQVGPGCWIRKEDYEDARDLWLAPKKEQVARLLRKLQK